MMLYSNECTTHDLICHVSFPSARSKQQDKLNHILFPWLVTCLKVKKVEHDIERHSFTN